MQTATTTAIVETAAALVRDRNRALGRDRFAEITTDELDQALITAHVLGKIDRSIFNTWEEQLTDDERGVITATVNTKNAFDSIA